MSIPLIGDPAPDFTLSATHGTTVSLSAYRGSKNVLIAFFPLAFTSTCTAEMCAFTEEFAKFESHDVAVIPVSVDSVPTLNEYKAKHAIAMEMASDFRREASRAFGVLNEEKFYSNRSYFLVDKAGVLRWAHVETVNGERRGNGELLAAIAALTR
ncbi:MAG: peroxiredoxin [Gemmatimonadetes bacterium]|nr:MAG: peroxiredoxin [Gemmatimonadota bacterium]